MSTELYGIILNALGWALAAIISVLLATLGWIGKQLQNELRSIRTELSTTNATLGNIEKDLRKDLSSLDRRVVRVEAHLGFGEHGNF